MQYIDHEADEFFNDLSTIDVDISPQSQCYENKIDLNNKHLTAVVGNEVEIDKAVVNIPNNSIYAEHNYSANALHKKCLSMI